MRVTDIFLAFPALLLALALAAVLPPSLTTLTIAIAAHLVALVHPADPRPGRVGGRAPLHRSCRALGISRLADHLPAHPAQLDHAR